MTMQFNVEDHSDEVLAAMESQLRAGMEAVGLTIERYAKAACPEDTGRLRNSISHTSDDTTAIVGTNTEYAAYVEMGTVHTRAQPYIKPAVENHMDEYKSLIENALKN